MKRIDKHWLRDERGRIVCIHCLERARVRDGKLIPCTHPVPKVLRPCE